LVLLGGLQVNTQTVGNSVDKGEIGDDGTQIMDLAVDKTFSFEPVYISGSHLAWGEGEFFGVRQDFLKSRGNLKRRTFRQFASASQFTGFKELQNFLDRGVQRIVLLK